MIKRPCLFGTIFAAFCLGGGSGKGVDSCTRKEARVGGVRVGCSRANFLAYEISCLKNGRCICQVADGVLNASSTHLNGGRGRANGFSIPIRTGGRSIAVTIRSSVPIPLSVMKLG